MVGDRGHGGALRIDSRADTPDCLPVAPAEMPVSAAWHKGGPYRRWPMTMGTVNAVGARAHRPGTALCQEAAKVRFKHKPPVARQV